MTSDSTPPRSIARGIAGPTSDDAALIGLLATDAGRRLRVFSAIGMGVFGTGAILATVLPPLLGRGDGAGPLLRILCLLLFGLSTIVHVFARRTGAAPAAVVRVGLLYVVVASAAMAIAESMLAAERTTEWRGVSGIGIWIVLFPLIIPCLPRQALVTSVASAAMLPLAYGVHVAAGGPSLPGAVLVKWWVPVFFCAGLSFVAALSIHRLSQALAEARAAVRKAGRYELVERIGEGGMGQVWLARHAQLPHDVAVKIIRPVGAEASRPDDAQELARRFRREAEAVALLSSQNTVRLFDYGIDEEGELFAVMEYLRGYDLKRLVEEHGVLHPARVIRILDQVCLSLIEAHAVGLVHRDIKPANIMLCQLGRLPDVVKVLDFGLVGATEQGADLLAGAGDESTVAGTPGFVAPEVLRGEGSTERSDIFAVGVVGYWLLTGTTLFPRDGGGEDIARHFTDDPVAPHERVDHAVSEDLSALILTCVARDVAQRPASAADLRAALHALGDADGWSEDDAREWWAAHPVV